MNGPVQRRAKIIIITGPTASGKTSGSLELAAAIDGEIINADVGQFYAPLVIGTAKPLLPHPKIPHHLFDLIKEPININVTEYRRMVFTTIEQLLARGKTPILVGGSLFYLKSLFFPPLELEPVQGYAHELDFEALYEHQTTEELWNILYGIDADRAEKLYKEDRYRILRALYLWHKFGKKPSVCIPQFETMYDVCLIYVTPEEQTHKKNIQLRAEQMLNEGWVDETSQLMGTIWEPFLEKKGLIGYPELISWIKQGKKPENKGQLIEKINQKTWQYARRQRIFWASFKRQLEFTLENYKKELIFELMEPERVEQIIDKICLFFKKRVK